jgi:hypothetical protein
MNSIVEELHKKKRNLVYSYVKVLHQKERKNMMRGREGERERVWIAASKLTDIRHMLDKGGMIFHLLQIQGRLLST